MLQRFTVIIRLQRDADGKEWHGQAEMVQPHRMAFFRHHNELWDILQDWLEGKARDKQNTLPGQTADKRDEEVVQE